MYVSKILNTAVQVLIEGSLRMNTKTVFRFAILLLKPFIGRITFQKIWDGLHGLSLIGMNFGSSYTSNSGECYVLNYVKEKCEKKDLVVIFDVGANIGTYNALVLSTFTGKNLKVFSFEPSPKTFERLKANISVNPSVVLKNFGLGEENKKTTLFSDGANSGLSSLYNRRLNHFGIEMDKTEKVEIQTLDNYCLTNNINHIHLLKIDVEGNELNVLKGAKRMIDNNSIDFIQFEFGGCNIDSKTYFQDFFYLLNPKYRIYRIVQNGLYLIEKYSERNEVFITINYLAEIRQKFAK
jgi:FkbM family methyltransferase